MDTNTRQAPPAAADTATDSAARVEASPTSSPSRTDPRGPRRPLTDEEQVELLRAAEDLARRRAATRPPATAPLATAVGAALREVKVVDADALARQDAAQERAQRAERVAAALARANVPHRYRDARFDDQAGVPAEYAAQYAAAVWQLRVAQDRWGIYALCGEIGSGKTHMACALVNAFCGAGRSAKYMKAADYITDYRSTWKAREAGAEDRFVRDHVRLALLVLDEWQVRNDTANENLLLLRLLDKRYESKGTTLLIGNHATRQEFEQSIDARVADRICDGGGFILCPWSSLRGRIQQRNSPGPMSNGVRADSKGTQTRTVGRFRL